MNGNLRWIILSSLLGLLTAYVIWGHPPTAVPAPGPVPEPPATVVAPTQEIQSRGEAPVIGLPSGNGGISPQMAADEKMHGLTDLRFEPEAINFGAVPVGETRVQSILVRNPTDRPINVKDLHPSCHCIEVKMADTVILPGQAQPIEVSFSALPNRKESTVTGFFKTDEKGTPDVSFRVHARVQQEINMEPSIVQFDRIKKHEIRTKEVVVRSADGLPFAITDVKGTRSEVAYKWAVVPNTNSSVYTLTVTLQPEHNGPLQEHALLTTDRSKTSSLPLYVSATLSPDLAATPPIVAADLMPGGSVGKFVVELRHTVPGKLDVRGVLEGLDAKYRMPLKYDVERLSDEAVKLTIEFTAPFPMRTPFGQFMIKTNVEEDDYRLPFRVNNAPKSPPGFPDLSGIKQPTPH